MDPDVGTGPIAEAHRTGRKLSICVRWTQASGASVLAACGFCQERLDVFGSEILIGVADPDAPGFRFRPLAELRPSPWWESVDPSGTTRSTLHQHAMEGSDHAAM